MNPWPPLLRPLFLKPFPSYYHVNELQTKNYTSFNTVFFLKPFSSHYHVNELQTKNHTSFKTFFFLKPFPSYCHVNEPLTKDDSFFLRSILLDFKDGQKRGVPLYIEHNKYNHDYRVFYRVVQLGQLLSNFTSVFYHVITLSITVVPMIDEKNKNKTGSASVQSHRCFPTCHHTVRYSC